MSNKIGSQEFVVCVYCASSDICHRDFHDAADRLGELLALDGCSIIYGGGAIGSMGALANGALRHHGRVVGVIPEFMMELEWGHSGLSELMRVEDMRTRKHLMLSRSDAVVALPGGTGTLEELLEALTLKKLGIYLNPIILVNTRGFFDPLLELFAKMVDERFMGNQHSAMWQVVERPDDVLLAIRSTVPWPGNAIQFAAQIMPDDPRQ